MKKLPGYDMGKTILKDERFMLLQGSRHTDDAPVLIKVPSAKYPQLLVIKELDHEFELRHLLEASWALHPVELVHESGFDALIYNFFAGIPVSTFSAPMEAEGFLEVAVAIVSVLAAAHQAGLVHCKLQPANILIDGMSGGARLTGFGMATRFGHHVSQLAPMALSEDELAFLAPEQTGQLNRGIDQQTDLYAAGAVFYQMLTGNAPCGGADALERIHCIVAITPVSPHEYRSDIPPILSSIVMKLLAKLPEERYRTAAGLHADLKRCLEQWRQSREIHDFPLGEQDVCGRLIIPQQLYGRNIEVSTLFGIYEEVVVTAAPHLVLVSGYAGTGKSRLVAELRRPAARSRSFFVSGKFEQYLRGRPYSIIAQACAELVQQILMETEEQLTAWREAIVQAVGVNGRLITDVVPELILVIGEQPAVPDLPLTEAENRFLTVFRKVLQLFCRQRQPLVLFLDDLQWADPGTLKLLSHILPHPETHSFLMICAYRDNELTPSHPAILAMEEIRRGGIPVRDVVLQPLTEPDVRQLIADTLLSHVDRVGPLSNLIFGKTGGNPFFLIQFLTTLYHDGLLTCNPVQAVWEWDLGRIRLQQYTDNVVSFLVDKMHGLPEEALQAMKFAACIGIVADLSLLSAVADAPETEIERSLSVPVEEGLMVRQERGYTFVHDRVQQAAYSLIDPERLPQVHITVARAYLAGRDPAETGNDLFTIIDQFNRGRSLIATKEERAMIAELNLRAGRLAEASAAYRAAVDYLGAGLEILGEECWSLHADLCGALTFTRARCAWLAGDLDDAGYLLEESLFHADDKEEKAEILSLRSKVAMTRGDPPGAAAVILQALELFGIRWSAHPERELVQREYQEVWNLLDKREIEALLDLPPMTDPTVQEVMVILSELYLPAYWIDLNLQLLVTCHMVKLSLQFGISDASPMGFAGFGRLLGPVYERYRDGYRIGKVAYDLVEKLKLVGYKARISDLFGISTSFWVSHVREGLQYARISFTAAGEAGDLPYACYACMHIVNYRIFKGDPLDDIDVEAERLLGFVKGAHYDEVADIITGMQRLIRNLRNETETPLTFSGGGFSQQEFESRIRRERSALVVVWYYVTKLQGRFLMGYHQEAVEAASELSSLISGFTTQLKYTDFVYYSALSLAAHHPAVSSTIQDQYLKRINELLVKLNKWSEQGGENFRHRYELVAAEHARLHGQGNEAEAHYEAAIDLAREHGFVQDQGVAQELAARYFLSAGDEDNARKYLVEARYSYARWGAIGKVNQLVSEFPRLIPEEQSTQVFTTSQLDLLAVTKASQAISQLTSLTDVVKTLLTVTMEYGGADRSVLFFVSNGLNRAVAEATIENAKVIVEQWPSGKKEIPVPSQFIKYGLRVRKTVLFEDVREPSQFSGDPYFTTYQPLSATCLPIIRQQELVGLLYLENRAMMFSFTQHRIVILELIASQAAISLQNAELYENQKLAEAELRRAKDELEIRVQERTEELTSTLHNLEFETQERIHAVEDLRKKEQMLIQQSRLAAMGEMLVNISHQWRQPLTILGLILQELLRNYKRGKLTGEYLGANVGRGKELIAHMSQTIDDFRKFFMPEKRKLSFDVTEVVEKTVGMIQASMQEVQVDLQLSGDPITIDGYRNEYAQVIINILMNARDAFRERGIASPGIIVRIFKENERAVVTISDNAGGIPSEIIDKVFDPYFTTKDPDKGTGIGLFMSKTIIEKNMNGLLTVQNTERGAEFRIEV